VVSMVANYAPKVGVTTFAATRAKCLLRSDSIQSIQSHVFGVDQNEKDRAAEFRAAKDRKMKEFCASLWRLRLVPAKKSR
jgi:hypothetical protein